MNTEEVREAIRAANERDAAERQALEVAAVASAAISQRLDGSTYRDVKRIVTRANRVSDAIAALLTELNGEA